MFLKPRSLLPLYPPSLQACTAEGSCPSALRDCLLLIPHTLLPLYLPPVQARTAEGSCPSALRDCLLLKPGSTMEDVYIVSVCEGQGGRGGI